MCYRKDLSPSTPPVITQPIIKGVKDRFMCTDIEKGYKSGYIWTCRREEDGDERRTMSRASSDSACALRAAGSMRTIGKPRRTASWNPSGDGGMTAITR